jgi:hypothetical protein
LAAKDRVCENWALGANIGRHNSAAYRSRNCTRKGGRPVMVSKQHVAQPASLPTVKCVTPDKVADPAPVFDGADYAKIPPGTYPAYCRSAKWYRDPQYKRWCCLLRFDILSVDLVTTVAVVPLWLNGGTAKLPEARRRSRYFALWAQAAAGTPRRGKSLGARVFTKRMATVEVGDTAGPAPYSCVKQVLRWDVGSTSQVVNYQHAIGTTIEILGS